MCICVCMSVWLGVSTPKQIAAAHAGEGGETLPNYLPSPPGCSYIYPLPISIIVIIHSLPTPIIVVIHSLPTPITVIIHYLPTPIIVISSLCDYTEKIVRTYGGQNSSHSLTTVIDSEKTSLSTDNWRNVRVCLSTNRPGDWW